MPSQILHGLDRDVYQLLVKFEEDHLQASSNGKLPKFTVSGVYDWIKRSNSSLARQKKRPLEDSIEKVLRLRKQERLEHDEEAALDSQPAPDTPQAKERDYFIMNKQITKQWNIPKREANPAATEATTSASEQPLAERQSNGEPKPKRKRTERPQEDRSPPTHVTPNDLGGMEDVFDLLAEEVGFPILFPELCAEMKFQGARGILLHGPPGCGKTMVANAFAAALGVPFISVSAPSLIAGMSGESEKKIRELYDEAKKLAPCLVFIDEIDAIMGKRENAQREMEKRIVAQMLTCMDDLDPEAMGNKVVATLAATNRPDSIDPALRRAGRFNREISLGIPNEASREAILKKLIGESGVAEDVDIKQLARRTPGFVGADLKDVVNVARNGMARALMATIVQSNGSDMDIDSEQPPPPIRGQKLESLKSAVGQEVAREKVQLTMQHLRDAIGKVQPSSKREGFSTIPDTTWEHVGALEDVREQLELSVVHRIQDPEMFAELGLANAASGVLLWGPPGCGKTLLAKAVANESKANFISVKGPELLNKYVGESERSVRQVFSRALASAPCILFFDELDALVPRRDSGVGADSSARVVNQLLTELDGMDSRAGVYVIGATNRPDVIDPAILRPGRLGKHIFIDLPNADGRVDILQRRIQRLQPKLSTVPGWAEQTARIARDPRCEGFSGADMDNLHIAAGEAAYKRLMLDSTARRVVTDADWEQALATTKRSVGEFNVDKYRVLKETGWE